MGKRKKKLAVLLAAAMTVTMMCGMTTFAAPESGESDPSATEPPVVAEISEPGGSSNQEPAMLTPKALEAPAPETPKASETPETPAPETPETPAPETPEVPAPETLKTPETPETPDSDVPDNPSSPDQNNDIGDGTTDPNAENDTPNSEDISDEDILDEDIPDEDIPDENIPDEDISDNDVIVDEYVPEPSVVMGSDNEEEPYVELDQSDDFVSLGEGKGSYQYTEGKLVLKDVNIELGEKWLPGLSITGTIVINLQGDNYISSKSDGINVFYGDLTINGDGSLTINCTGDVGDGIYVSDGSLTIDGAKVTVNTETKYGSDAITVYDGDVNIINGADVTANAKITGDEAKYASVYGIHAWNGKINIKDSNVTAKADGKISLEGEMKDWIRQNGVGLYSQSYDIYSPDSETARPAGIVIDNSNVNASGSFAAMLVIGKDGTITIKNSSIVAPDDANIRALMATIADDPDAAAVQIGAILAKGEGPVDLDAIMEEYYRLLDEGDDAALAEFLTSILDNTVKDVKIVRDSELVTAEKSVSLTPQTGDSFHAETLLLVLAVSGCICAYLIRKKVIA
ncbi:MAG TPA: hypothetical protein H9695_11555 [Candidatus Mediterraneibacter excrementigallinarum]|nr:hypothetical protein [Candidatus Mediterraneibacter excrementigallinarum]